MALRLGLVHLRLALLLQPVLLELLGVKRLRRILLLGLVLRPALATLGTITPVGAASAAAAAVTSPAAGLFAFLLRLTVAVLRSRIGSLLHGSLRRPLLLRRTRRALIGAALALRTLGGLAFGLRKLALLLDLVLRLGLALRTLALGAIRPRLLLLRRARIAARLVVAALMIPFSVTLAARLITPALAALLVIAFAVAVATRLAIAPRAAFAAVPVT